MNDLSRLNSLWYEGCKFLGTKYAIMCGAMSWISESSLVSAVSNAGGFGVIACGAMDCNLLSREIDNTFAKTDKPFGINLIVMHPMIEELVDVCISKKVSHVIFAGGVPKKSVIEKLKYRNIKVMCFAPTVMIGQRMVKNGADALIIEGMEAGGHVGNVATSVLVQEIIPNIKEVPIFVAGGVGTGDIMSSYLLMGAQGCQLGTRFVCAHESIAHPAFKDVFINANSRDAVLSKQLDENFPVIPVRAIENSGSKRFLALQREVIDEYKAGNIPLDEGRLRIEKFWAGALRRAVIEGDVHNGSLMAGQCVGLVKERQSVEEIIQQLIQEALNYLGR